MNKISIITNNEAETAKAVEVLKYVLDPEIGLNVADLGLIYQLDFDDTEKKLFCSHTLTTQFCPMGSSIQSGILNALEQQFPEYAIVIKLVFEPHWNSSLISDEGREFLNN